ncbi:MAG: PD40 domain-containing protein [Actinobacteria bacterium]|nr:PD40 domain-containing protein [Actinomycetota bacterium]
MLSILLAIGLVFVMVFAGMNMVDRITGKNKPGEAAVVSVETSVSPEEETPEETGEEIIEEPEVVEKIEFYIDGPEETGLPAGEVVPEIPREDAARLFGEEYLNSGFEHEIDLTDFDLEPGIHTLFIYARTNRGNSKYAIKKLPVSGEREETATTILIDYPKNYSTIYPEKMTIQGWAINEDFTDSTGIDRVEVYIDGTRDNGIFLGDANYGTITRDDISGIYGPQFAKSGYHIEWDASEFKANEDHFIYVYAHVINGDWEYGLSEVYIFDEEKDADDFILEIDSDFSTMEIGPEDSIDITGWTVFPEGIEGMDYEMPEEETAEKEAPEDAFENRKIVFVSDRDGGDFDLYISNTDGSDLTQLTFNDSDDLYPAVSPDNQKIAFTSTIGDLWQLMVINIDGTGLEQLTHSDTLNAYPSWSYDGKYIFFETRVGEDWEIGRINSDGSGFKRLTYNPDSDDWHPACHPGKPLVYFESGKNGRENISLMDFEGKNMRSVIKDGERNRTPDISSDKDLMVFSSYRSTGDGEIFVSGLNGEDPEQITSLGGRNIHPALSPYGSYIAFDTDYRGKLRIYIYSFVDDSLTKLIDDDSSNYKDPDFLYY